MLELKPRYTVSATLQAASAQGSLQLMAAPAATLVAALTPFFKGEPGIGDLTAPAPAGFDPAALIDATWSI